MTAPPTVAMLSIGMVEDDPRVRRVGDALARAGMLVRAFGIGRGLSAPPAWPIAAADSTRLSQFGGDRASVRLAKIAGSRILPSLAERVYWAQPEPHALMEAAKDWPADVYFANDWKTLPLAASLAQRHHGVFFYDSHELATEEMAHLLQWRLLYRPYVSVIEGKFIRQAARVATVSAGIADVLYDRYNLTTKPLIVRNAPEYQLVPYHDVDPACVTVLYHGLLVPNRGLEETISSVAQWRREFRLVLRGNGTNQYRAQLTTMAERAGVSDRVIFDPPVKMTELVQAAAPADIGILALPNSSRHNIYALPNKVFEYVMAGLALCVSNLPDLARVVCEHQCGRLIEAVTSHAIARAINSFDAPEIRKYRARALAAARVLNWELESQPLVAAICESARARLVGTHSIK
jgi:glycosyltransferase involved in cell wall biosynthesis